GVENYLISRGIQVWSADFPADDWRHVSSDRVYQLAMQRLEAKGKGILLLHDIQARTVAALPKILQTLKARGYRIVHVVPATPERPATPTDPQQWRLHPASETVAISRWPKIPRFAFASTAALPAPALSDLDWRNADLRARAQRRARSVPLPPITLWPTQMTLPPDRILAALPVPAASIFRIPESSRVTMLARGPTAPTLRATEVSAKLAGQPRRHRGAAAVRPAASMAQPPEEANGTAPKPAAPARKNGRSVHVAGLKKR